VYGGMGGLNDVVLCQYNGDRVSPADEDRVNERLKELLSRIWTDARALLDDLDRS
jgi:hypothetical protein